MRKPALLALEDGTVFRGFSCGADGEARGELVFNTSMTGYQEVLTDPSYKGQLVLMTYPLIGNTGITDEDHESGGTSLEGFVVREMCKAPSNWQSRESLPDFLRRRGVAAIEGVDTRALTLRLREKGSLLCALSTRDLDPKSLAAKARRAPSTSGRDLASLVSCRKAYSWSEPFQEEAGRAVSRRAGGGPRAGRSPLARSLRRSGPPRGPRVLVLDYGVKRGMLRALSSLGCEVTVMPGTMTAAEDAIRLRPDGVLLSNGPGDPEPLGRAVETIRRLLDARIPLFGICLGHQLLGLALGGKTFKLKFGHHGSNHPVKDLSTGRVMITSQNHNFCVDLASLPPEVRTTHVNLNDGTSEGMAHSQLPAFSVQFHPEACAGPHDARSLFGRFLELMPAADRPSSPGPVPESAHA